jgi:hypothetical protein
MGAEYCFGGLVWQADRREHGNTFGWPVGIDRFCFEGLGEMPFEKCY